MYSLLANPITWIIITLLIMGFFPKERSAAFPAMLTLILTILMFGFTTISWLGINAQQVQDFFYNHKIVGNPLLWFAILLFNFPGVGIGRIPPVKRFWKESPDGSAPGHTCAKVILDIAGPIMVISIPMTMLTLFVWIDNLTR